jgi:hypothetical protein
MSAQAVRIIFQPNPHDPEEPAEPAADRSVDDVNTDATTVSHDDDVDDRGDPHRSDTSVRSTTLLDITAFLLRQRR